jgi:hypothetical protein
VAGLVIVSAGRIDSGMLVINPIIYAEVSARFERIEELDDALPLATIVACRRRGKRRFWPASVS